jgi:hypothetical protein
VGDLGRPSRKCAQVESFYCLDLKRPARLVLYATYDKESGFAVAKVRSMLEVTDWFDVPVGDEADFLSQLTKYGLRGILIRFAPTAWKSPALGVAECDENHLPLRRERNGMHTLGLRP